MGTEDRYGIWEAAAAARTADPCGSEESWRRAARVSLVSLVRQGLIELVWFDDESGVEEPVDRAALLRVLDDTTCWVAPRSQRERALWFFATDKGMKAYFGPTS